MRTEIGLQLLRFLKARMIYFMIGAGVILFGGAIGIAYQIYAEKRYLSEHEKFAELLKKPYFSVVGTEKGTIEGLDLAIEKLKLFEGQIKGRSARMRSNVYLLSYLEKKGSWEKARDICKFLAENVRFPELKVYYLYRAGIFSEQINDWSNAENFFEQAELLISENAELLKTKILLSILRVRQAQNKNYTDILDKFYRVSYENLPTPILAEFLLYAMREKELEPDSVDLK